MAIHEVLVTWVGKQDLKGMRGEEDTGPGPVATALGDLKFDAIELLTNYSLEDSLGYADWIRSRAGDAEIRLTELQLESPIDHDEIYQKVVACLAKIRERNGPDPKLTYHLSPGTPAMHAIWILIAKTKEFGSLIQTTREQGLQKVNFPFDVAAEYNPGVFKRHDRRIIDESRGATVGAAGFEDVIYQSEQMAFAVDRARTVAQRNIPVLIEGESGTGKELFARAIHESSAVKSARFVVQNCGAMPEELTESILFGHKKGAFTGANKDTLGAFGEADGGTLFLDEVGELSPAQQVKLLRALQDGKITHVGESTERAVQVRVIAATNRRLVDEVRCGRFRADLFYRLAVAVIALPPLRTRAGDIGLLIDHFLQHFSSQFDDEPNWQRRQLSVRARKFLLEHNWPGNVRELRNTILRILLWSQHHEISQQEVASSVFPDFSSDESALDALLQQVEQGLDFRAYEQAVRAKVIRHALDVCGGIKARAAEKLQFTSTQTLTDWMKRLNID